MKEKVKFNTKKITWRAIAITGSWRKAEGLSSAEVFWGWDIFFNKIPILKATILLNIGITLLINYLF